MAIDKIGSKALTDSSVVAADISPGTITADKLASTLNVSSKTVTLPNTSVTSGMLAGSIANAKLANSTVTVNGTSIALGASGSIPAVTWQSVVVSNGSTVTTMVAGRGYFINNTSAVGLVKLPLSASAGDTIAIKDYAGNFGTNSLTIQRNGHNIQGVANDSLISTNRASLSLVYVDATKGWLYAVESNVADLQQALYVTATGGTITTVDTNFKVHTFTGDGCFVVSQAGNSVGNNKIDYLVIGGGASNGPGHVGGGGGAGGYRESHSTPVSGPYTASPLATPTGLTVGAQTYPVTVGGGGNNPSTISTITSTAGGGGGNSSNSAGSLGKPGGSGGGGGGHPGGTCGSLAGGSGNTPPVSPPQGNNGGSGNTSSDGPGGVAGGGGGAGAVGANSSGGAGGNGGAGVASTINGSSVTRAGGGGGSSYSQTPGTGGSGGGGNGSKYSPSVLGTNGTANTGGGAGGDNLPGRQGGSGIVIVRYKFQN